ncbi:DEAD/DEAH box helicase [Micromonospora sp. NPDC050200]|uniref:DEAD/DEAH box helicase n=1 Tax=Micromonospora sp. NPDC050200 TaxID=3155664 RepID=UPI0033F92C9F
MPLDWSRIGAGDREPLVRPRDIFAALPRKPWSYLRQEQGEILEKWYARRHERDIPIKQNTGGGKTAVGLLIAQSSLNEKVGKAVYLAPDTYLAERVRQEAATLGIATASSPDQPAFLAQEAILVTTFQKVVNGRSVFGVVGDGREVTDLGIVVVDDAHSALATTEGQFRLLIPAGHAAYPRLVDMFAADLRHQTAKGWADIRAGEYNAVVRIPFWSWADRQDEVLQLLHQYRDDKPHFFFTWPLIAAVLPLCAAVVTSRGVEIRPPCPPIRMVPSFNDARRRVYLTATLTDDSVLVTDLDADPESATRPVTPGSAADLGERMILAPISLNPGMDEHEVRVLGRQFADGDRDGDGQTDADPVNVVVLVPSDRAAAAWSKFADRIYHVGDLAAGVEELRAGHVGVVVLVNKYDGVDLPQDACRLLIVDGIPRPVEGVERREAEALRRSPALRAREVQRIEQGMGRGVRDSSDYCAVLLLGARLGVATYDSGYLELFSPATQAQLALSRDVANQIQGEGLDAVRAALSACLDRAPQWVERSRRALADVAYADRGRVRPEAVAVRQAFDLAEAGQTAAAADRLQQTLNDIEDSALRGWLREQRAAYLHMTDRAAAQHQLATAVKENPDVLRPAAGIAVVQTRPVAVQARAAAQYLTTEYGQDAMNLVLGVRALVDEIQWDNERTNEAEAALERLGLHLGFASTRPEKIYGTGPDNLWALSADRHAVIELKTGSTTATVAKKDIDQLGGSVRWDIDQHPGVTALPIMLHPSAVLDEAGSAVPGMRVVTPERLDRLKAAVVKFVVALADGPGRWHDDNAVRTQLAHHRLDANNIFQNYAEVARTSAK